MITTRLYKGSIELNFDESRHIFTVSGEPVISVTACTSVIDKSAPLIWWAVGLSKNFLLSKISEMVKDKKGDTILRFIEEASKQHQIKKEEAATVGTEAHKWVELFIKSKTDKDIPKLPEDSKVYNAVSAFLKWVDENKVKFISSEKYVYSKKHQYAGIMDAEAVIGNRTSVIDFKTSKGLYPEFRFQVAAYQAASEEESGKEYAGDKWLARFDKETGEFEAHQFGDQDKDFKAFLSAMNLRKRLKELSKK